MTPAKPTPGAELVEPLRQFLETFTQELTEQQFIPAFRGELGKLAEGLDNIQQSGETLQQIAKGVDRLREVFAPAGTRMLEGVKEIELQMRAGGDQMRARAEEVLGQLAATHKELDQALRTEAGLLGEQTSTSRETLNRISGEIDEQLRGFSSKLDNLCRKAEQEINQLSQLSARAIEQQTTPSSAPSETAQVQTVAFTGTAELAELMSRTETTVTEELSRHTQQLRELLSSNTRDHNDRLARIDKTIDDALRAVAPKVQSELDAALARLRDQMDAIVRLEREGIQQQREQQQQHEEHAQPAPAVDPSVFVSALSGIENRVLREFDELRKSSVNELSEIQKSLSDFALDLADITEKQTERVQNEQQSVKELLVRLERLSKERSTTLANITKQVGENKQQFDQLITQSAQSTNQVVQHFSASLEQINSQSTQLHQLADSADAWFSKLTTLLGHTEEQVGRLLDQHNNESRVTRERIEAGVVELRGRYDGRFDQLLQRSEEIASKLGTDFHGHLETLRHEVDNSMQQMGEVLKSDLQRYDTLLRDQNKQQEATTHGLTAEVSRAANLIDEKLSGFESKREENERFTRAIESHVKVVATEVSALRSKQQETLEVLKEAIRANYDDNATRLKEVIDGAYDQFLEQIRTVPQALDRYAKFVETMHQSNQLALQGISGDTSNILTVAQEIKSEAETQKKFFPLLNKMMEKHSQMLEAVRRSQSDHDKNFAQVSKTGKDTHDDLAKSLTDVKGELRRIEGAEQAKLTELTQMHMTTYSELENLQRNDLPAFRREVIQLVQSKFEFIENTQAERQSAMRAEMMGRLEAQEQASKQHFKKLFMLVAGAALLQIVLQSNLLSLIGL